MEMTPLMVDRRRWLHERDLYDLMGRLAGRYMNRIGANAADVGDVKHDAYVVATEAAAEGRGPTEEPGMRPYLCCTLKYLVINRARKIRPEVLTDPDEMPPIPATTEAEVREEVERFEQGNALAREIQKDEPVHAHNVTAEQQGPASERTRKRKQRSKAFLVAKYGAAFAAIAAAFVFFVRRQPEVLGLEPAGTLTTQRARGVRDAALSHCDASEWAICEAGLDDAKALDPHVEEWPPVQRARERAKQARLKAAPPTPPQGVTPADNRREGLERCKQKSWFLCLDLLDSARTYDPQGDLAPEVSAARREAREGIEDFVKKELDNAKRGLK